MIIMKIGWKLSRVFESSLLIFCSLLISNFLKLKIVGNIRIPLDPSRFISLAAIME